MSGIGALIALVGGAFKTEARPALVFMPLFRRRKIARSH